MLYIKTRKQKEELSDIIDDVGILIYDIENNDEKEINNDLLYDLKKYKSYLMSKQFKKFTIIKYNKKLMKLLYI